MASAEGTAAGPATVWHRLNPDSPNGMEHERLTCRDADDTRSCRYDKVEEAMRGFGWDATTGEFSGDDVTVSWTCPTWFPAAV